MWTTSDLIKGLWLLRNKSHKEPRVWWTAHALIVLDAPSPAQMDEGTRWTLSELRWVYVLDGGELGESHWMLLNVGGA